METSQGPRWHIDRHALNVLEACFAMEQFPNVNVRKQLGNDLQVSARQIQVWFQNRRQRERKRRETQRTGQSTSTLGSSTTLKASYSTLNASSEEISSVLMDFGDDEERGDGEGEAPPDDHAAKRARLGIPLAPVPNEPLDEADASSDLHQAKLQDSSASSVGGLKTTTETETVTDSVPGSGATETVSGAATCDLSFGNVAAQRSNPASPANLESQDSKACPPVIDVPSRSCSIEVGSAAPAADKDSGNVSPPPPSGPVTPLAPSSARFTSPVNKRAQHAAAQLTPALYNAIGSMGSTLASAQPDELQRILSGHSLRPGVPPLPSTGQSGALSESAIPSVAERLANACQGALLGRTLKRYGGIIQVITEATPPYRALSVSPGWQKLCGYTRDDALGSPLNMLQGPATESDAIVALMRSVRMQMPISVRLTNYTKGGVPFIHQLSCEPLRDPTGETRCFQATSLVLQAPGETLSADEARLLASTPPISYNHVPPLWPLLGRAMLASSGNPHTLDHGGLGRKGHGMSSLSGSSAAPAHNDHRIGETIPGRPTTGPNGNSRGRGSKPAPSAGATKGSNKRSQQKLLARRLESIPLNHPDPLGDLPDFGADADDLDDDLLAWLQTEGADDLADGAGLAASIMNDEL